MSSRLMPPSVGSIAAMMSTSLSGSRSASSMSNTSMPANFLNRQPLPSITGLAASGPMSPRPSTAVPLVMTPTRLPREVNSCRQRRVGLDVQARVGHAGRIGQRQVALVRQRLGRRDRDLAACRAAVVVARRLAQSVFGEVATLLVSPRRICSSSKSTRQVAHLQGTEVSTFYSARPKAGQCGNAGRVRCPLNSGAALCPNAVEVNIWAQNRAQKAAKGYQSRLIAV
jgi:hypothetical protein